MRRSLPYWMNAVILVASLLFILVFSCRNALGGAVESLEASLKKQGFESGYNASSDSYVFIGSSEHDLEASDIHSMDVLRRNVWCLEAELNARKTMVKVLMTKFRISGESEVSNDRGRAVRKSHSDSEHWAQRVLLGCTTVGSEEVYSDGRYQIAVAVKWSEKDERRTIESFLDVKHGATAFGVWTNWLSQTDVAVLPSTWSFEGEDGMIRHVGIGYADVEGIEDSSLFMQSAKDSALTWARTSLSLALCSDFSSFDRVMFDLKEQTGSEEAHRQLETKLNSYVTRVSRKLTAFAPEVYFTFAVHPITKRKIYVSVCGYEPWELAELGIIDRKMLQRSRVEVSTQKSATEDSGVMIFNPNTGEYERKE